MRYITAGLLLSTALTLPALADPRTDCPNPPTACKVITLTAEEEKILLDERGILATAAQARSLDLGSLATYFQQKIAKAPAGDVREAAKPNADNPTFDISLPPASPPNTKPN